MINKKCIICSEEFKPRLRACLKKVKYCSHKCGSRVAMRKWYKKIRLNNPQFIHNKKRLWREKFRESIRKSDKLWRNKNKDKCKQRYYRWINKNPEKAKFLWRIAAIKRRKAGYLSIQIIQQVYEDNIKKYGTLTCHLCLKFIKFGEDSIDHIIPISKGGMHNKENLEIAHLICNKQRGNKALYRLK